jgi:hypothetical protein
MHPKVTPPVVAARAAKAELHVDAVGHLVPAGDFQGHVHSRFARACNLQTGDTLFGLCDAAAGDGPTTLRLGGGAPHDLREWFDDGEPFHVRDGTLRTGRVVVHWRLVPVWRPPAARALLAPQRIDARLAWARRRCESEQWDRGCAGLPAALGDACRAGDRPQAASLTVRMIGRGEGLTPACDDFLVGMLAGLDRLGTEPSAHGALRDTITRAVLPNLSRTTAISSHGLRLAAGGHYNALLLELRHALVAAPQPEHLEPAWRRALAVGATSGAATASGLCAGLAARAALGTDAAMAA